MTRSFLWLGFALAFAVQNTLAEENRTIEQLLGTGIRLTDEVVQPLPPPSIDSSLSKEQQQKKLESLTRGRGWSQFTRKSTNAPVTINLSYIKDAQGNKIGHRVHFAFVIHASLDTLQDKDLMKSIADESDKPDDAELYKMEELSADDLKSHGITQNSGSFAYVEAPLLNRVIIRGTIRNQQIVSDDAVMVVWEMDPRFTGQNSWANTWCSLQRDRLGKKVQGKPQPYQGVGGYLHVTSLPDNDDACLVESQMVIHEPADWFSSSTALRSKMPLLIQNSARDFRRKLANR